MGGRECLFAVAIWCLDGLYVMASIYDFHGAFFYLSEI